MPTDSKIYVADANGDGKSDLFIFFNGRMSVYTMDSTNTSLFRLYEYVNSYISIASNKTILLGDYNGDGKTDFIIPKGYGMNYVKFLSTGEGVSASDQTYDIPFNPNTGSECPMISYIIPSDFDLDGKTDLILAGSWGCPNENKGQISIRNYKNIGTNFVSNMYTGTGNQIGMSPYSIPIFLSVNKQSYNQEISFISGSRLVHFNSEKNFNKDKLLKSITTGDGVIETITYKPMIPEGCPSGTCFPTFTNELNVETYPNYDINMAPTFQLVSKIEKQSSTVYKRQLFSYHGAVSNVEGLGFMGFRSVAATNWHDNSTPIITSITKSDISLRGATKENFVVLGLVGASNPISPTDPFITKNFSFYNTDINTGIFTNPLQTNKVFKLSTTGTQSFDGLTNTSQETKVLYDSYNNPLQQVTNIKNDTVLEKTAITNTIYDSPTTAPYCVGRPNSKIITVTINPGLSSQNMSIDEDLYQYNNQLISQVKSRSTNSGVTTNYLTEDNIYNGFGNLTKKTVTAVGLAPRETNFEYDASERFMTKETDLEGLITQYEYNNSSGVLNFIINPFGQKTSFEYDKWFKKTKITDYLLKNIVYNYSKTPNTHTVTKIVDDGSSNTKTYDDLGRLIKIGFKNVNGDWSFADKEYDIYDKIKKSSEPYFGTTPSQNNETYYDTYGRVSQSISYTGKITTTTYSNKELCLKTNKN